jgi:hypothetical protein
MVLSLPLKRVIVLALVIAAGVALRFHVPGFHIPAFWVKYGGSALWAAMFFFVVALLLRARPRSQVLYIAALICVLIECVKLVHTPALDVFRLTAAGAWTLGRVFSPWNFLAYGVGLALAFGLDRLFESKKSGRRRR